MNKKGQAITFQSAPGVILTLVLIGMVLGAGVIALAAFRDSTVITTGQVNNFTALNSTAVRFAASTALTCSGTTFVNSTGQDDTSSFTVSDCTASLTDNTQNNTNHQATYTATVEDTDAATAINNTISGAVNVSQQLPTVGTLVGVGLILLVVVGTFLFFGKRQE